LTCEICIALRPDDQQWLVEYTVRRV